MARALVMVDVWPDVSLFLMPSQSGERRKQKPLIYAVTKKKQ